MKILYTIILYLLLLPLGFMVGQSSAKYLYENEDIIPKLKNAFVLATTKIPETFTELYFEDHIGLPNRIEIGKEQYFKFTIHNLEYKDMTYKYEVIAIDNTVNTTLSSGSVELLHDGYKTIAENYTLATASGRIKVQVTLVDKDQSIAFWLEENI